jgi:Tfp pilus assembly PilM family ATPase
LDQIARSEFARTHKLDANSFEFAYWDLPAVARAAKSTTAMAFGVPHACCDELLGAITGAGLTALSLDAEPCALARSCRDAAPPESLHVILDLGWESSRSALVHQGALIYYRRMAGFGLSRLHAAVQQQLGLSEDVVDHLLGPTSEPRELGEQIRRLVRGHFDSVAAELHDALAYAAHQYPDSSAQHLILTGGGACIDGVADMLSTRLRLAPAVVAHPAAMLSLGLASFGETAQARRISDSEARASRGQAA